MTIFNELKQNKNENKSFADDILITVFEAILDTKLLCIRIALHSNVDCHRMHYLSLILRSNIYIALFIFKMIANNVKKKKDIER